MHNPAPVLENDTHQVVAPDKALSMGYIDLTAYLC